MSPCCRRVTSRIELLEAADAGLARSRKFLEKRGPGPASYGSARAGPRRGCVTRLAAAGVHAARTSRGTGAGGHLYVFVHPAIDGWRTMWN